MSNEHEIKAIAHINQCIKAWTKTRDEILAALRGNPQARAENFKEVERIRQRERVTAKATGE